MSYTRFAIYYVPPAGPLADAGASWLGWDIAAGRDVARAMLPGLPDITATPRKYGFHGTLKPPFRLSEGRSQMELEAAMAVLATTLAPATCDGLDLAALGGFVALVPRGEQSELENVAERCVRALDDFRAPAGADEIARRRATGLSARQDALIERWGYPYVMDEFRFHMTLSARLPMRDIPAWIDAARRHLPVLPAPFVMDSISLCGERDGGRFELIHRYTLAG